MRYQAALRPEGAGGPQQYGRFRLSANRTGLSCAKPFGCRIQPQAADPHWPHSSDEVLQMPESGRSGRRRRRVRVRFWDAHAEKLRLALIGGGMVLVTSLAAQMFLR
jgi:hypothetical protein